MSRDQEMFDPTTFRILALSKPGAGLRLLMQLREIKGRVEKSLVAYNLDSPITSTPFLPPEILLRIIGHLPRSAAYRAALVSKLWSECARTLIFSRVELKPSDTFRSYQKELRLGRALSNPFIGPLIRTLRIDLRASTRRSDVGEAALKLLGMCNPTEVFLALGSKRKVEPFLMSSGLSRVKRLVLGDPITTESTSFAVLNRVMGISSLESLDIIYSMQGNLDPYRPISSSPSCRLRHLKLWTLSYLSPTFLDFVAALADSLDYLEFDLWNQDQQNIDILTSCIRMVSPELRELRLKSTYPPTEPILDELIPSLGNLERLSCGTGWYSTALFPLLPRSLTELHLNCAVMYPDPPFLPIGELHSFLQSRTSAHRLNRVVVTSSSGPSYDDLLEALEKDIRPACKAKRIEFDIVSPLDFLDGNMWTE